MPYISIFFCWFKQTSAKEKDGIYPSSCQVQLNAYFHTVYFQFYATKFASCILNKCDFINNNAKQEHFIYISHINLSG